MVLALAGDSTITNDLATCPDSPQPVPSGMSQCLRESGCNVEFRQDPLPSKMQKPKADSDLGSIDLMERRSASPAVGALEDLAVELANDPLHLQPYQHRGHPACLEARPTDEQIDVEGAFGQEIEYALLLHAQIGQWGGRHPPTLPALQVRDQLPEDILPALDQLGPGLDQPVAPLTIACVDSAGNGKDFPALLQGVVRRDERPAVHAGLHHDHPQAQAADDAVAPRKMGSEGSRAQRKLTEEPARAGHLLRQRPMLRRVDLIQTAPEYGQGPSGSLQGAPVGRRVDPTSQTADDRETSPAQLGAKLV